MEATTEPIQAKNVNTPNVDSKGLEGVSKILSSGLPNTEKAAAEEKTPVAKTLVDNLTRDLVKEGAEEIKPEVVKDAIEEVKTEQAPAVAETPSTQVTEEVKIEPNFWEEEAPVTVEKQEEIKAGNIKELELKAKAYEEILEDKLAAAWFSAKKSGKDIHTFLADVQGVDPNKMSLEDLQREQLKRENPDPAYIEKGMEEFAEYTDRQKLKEVQGIKNTLKAEQENRLREYASNNQESQKKMVEIGHKALKEKEQYLESQKGKKVMGIEMTPTLISELNNAYENFNIEREDKTIDVPRIMNLLLLEKKSKLIAQTAYSKGRTDMELEFYKTHSRPSKDNGIANVPEVKNQNKQSQDEANMNALEKKFSHRGQGSRVN